LNHEILDHAMEDDAIVETLPRQKNKVVDGARGFIGVQVNYYIALLRMNGGSIGFLAIYS
jgi:hypothetical protein